METYQLQIRILLLLFCFVLFYFLILVVKHLLHVTLSEVQRAKRESL